MKFGTKAIHAGQEPDPSTGAIMTPIFQTSTYWQKSPGDNKGFEYSRGTNPTRKALEDCLAALENAKYGLAFSSGMGATDAVMKLLAPGDEVITGNDLYGGSYRIFTKIFSNYGIKFHFIDMTDSENVQKYVNDQTKLIWIETPTNPTMQIVDIEAVSKIAKQNNILLAVDNTFASPYLQNPIDLGADIVMHSVTKYLGGHSDVVMGALMLNDDELYKRLWFIYNACGATPGPMDSFLVLRGLKTLHLRMKAHCENGRQIAEFLKTHPKVEKFTGMISITLKGADLQETYRIASSFKSLINHPVSMTHGSIPKSERDKVGVVDNLLRLSVGVEDVEDLLEDLKQALS
ncbi:cystathionine gammasynthase [Daphnia sinensis]|uniref:cystathionine gamma-lyase n=1 Tax=Daphnia sinensis TaxID=1820382 RepID=A0AAD5KF44_9CRUS|nr:cystathionine gammasynthase [Daphnia sinensis]